MNREDPVYFPFTFLEPERVERLYALAGKFISFRVFEKSVSEEVIKKEGDGKILTELFRLSSENAVKIARRFLEWSAGRDQLDLKALSAFFNYVGQDDDSGDIIKNIMDQGDETFEEPDLNRLLLRHEIALFLFQLKDRQDYEIVSALSRISESHRKLFFELDAEGGEVPEPGMPVRSDFRLANMEARISSWFVSFLFLSDAPRLIFTDEKEAFLGFLELFRDDEIRVFRAGNTKDVSRAENFRKITSFLCDARDLNPALCGCIETGKPVFIEDGELFFAVPGNAGIKRAVSRILGLKPENSMLSGSYGRLTICMVA